MTMSEIPPLIEPRACSIHDLREILATDPNASDEYRRELERREARQAEVEHWEDRFGVDD
jgi:5'-deoxynucleotidase YfbR-like HD superfamily hydrolase